MSKKDNFIKIVQNEVFDNENINEIYTVEEINDALEFFEGLKKEKSSGPSKMTDNGRMILSFMQKETEADEEKTFICKEIAEALFTSGRSVSGSLRKLVNDGYVEKTGGNPISYSLTEEGKVFNIEVK